MAAKSSFKLQHPLELRQTGSARIRDKYPDRIPVIVEKVERSDVPDIDKKKYLVPADLTVGQFVYVIRKRIKIPDEKAIFMFVNNTLPPTAALMSAIFEENKDADGFLYMTYSGENTFGFNELYFAAPQMGYFQPLDRAHHHQPTAVSFSRRHYAVKPLNAEQNRNESVVVYFCDSED